MSLLDDSETYVIFHPLALGTMAKTSTGDGNLTFRVAVGDGNRELGLPLEKRWLPLKTRPRALERRRRMAGGPSGDYPGCTDLPYQHAISNGADVLDCPVQRTKNGIPVCLGPIDLMDNTLVAQSMFNNITRHVPKHRVVSGIFTFDLTWSETRTSIPSIFNPYAAGYVLFRNPNFKNIEKFMTLSERSEPIK
ncbi:glycerophosphodiester phosphodiesterase [Sarracenia purpurea var. burkii]